MSEVLVLVLMILPFVQATSLEEENDVDEVTVEILAVLEKNLSDRFQTPIYRHSHFCTLFEDVNDLYKNIDGLKLNIALKGLKIIEDLEDQPFLENHMVTNRHGTFINESSLLAFRYFAMSQEWLQEYDAVILLVNKTITDGTVFGLGNAFTPGFCQSGHNVAIGSPNPSVIVHDIALLFGVRNAVCSKEGKYSMTSETMQSEKFSNCSANELRKRLRNESLQKCLREKKAKDTAKCNPCAFLSGSECTNYDGIMKTLGYHLE